MKHKIGTKIYIVEDLRNNGNATGRYGVYNGVIRGVPVLVLDNGETLHGNQCLWKALDDGRLLNEEQQQKDKQVVGKTKTKNRAKNRFFYHHKKQRNR